MKKSVALHDISHYACHFPLSVSCSNCTYLKQSQNVLCSCQKFIQLTALNLFQQADSPPAPHQDLAQVFTQLLVQMFSKMMQPLTMRHYKWTKFKETKGVGA